MEVWQGLSYESLMGMPITRRRRLLQRKLDLEKQRKAEHDTSMSRSRSRR